MSSSELLIEWNCVSNTHDIHGNCTGKHKKRFERKRNMQVPYKHVLDSTLPDIQRPYETCYHAHIEKTKPFNKTE